MNECSNSRCLSQAPLVALHLPRPRPTHDSLRANRLPFCALAFSLWSLAPINGPVRGPAVLERLDCSSLRHLVPIPVIFYRYRRNTMKGVLRDCGKGTQTWGLRVFNIIWLLVRYGKEEEEKEREKENKIRKWTNKSEANVLCI